MKVLAIRGKNLASLAGDFEVRLDAGPLGAAGLFAITGPTGAGKTTLLDALCLALYDTTPRLHGQSRAQIGRQDDEERLGDRDVRGVLRRGAAEGFAEVDFEGTDRRRWRARWEVRRARGRATGRLQPQEMSLRELDTEVAVPGRRSEILQHIVERTGLTFDQLRRSMLLAQGEFAAFLHADGRERASLLEKITGTGLYSRVSRLAFERARHEKLILDDLRRQHDSTGVLTAEERATLDAATQRLSEELRDLEQVRQEAEAAVRWWGEQRQREVEVQQARDGLSAAQALAAAQGDRRSRLEEARAVEPLRPVLQRHDALHADLQRVGDQIDDLLRAVVTARAARDEAADQAAQAQAAAESARAVRQAEEPALQAAAELDGQLHQQRRSLAERQDDQRRLEKQLAEARREEEGQRRQVVAAEEEERRLCAWLEEHTATGTLAARWSTVEAALRRVSTGAGMVADAERRAQGARTKLEKLERSRSDAAARHEAARRARDEAAAAVVELPPERRAALSAARTRLETAREAAEGLARAAAAERKAAARAADATARAEQEQTRARRATEEQQAAVGRQSEQRARLEEARSAQALVLAARSLDDQRAHLVDGEPCPLCGATEHPWAEALPASVAHSLEGRLAELEAQLALAVGDEARSKAIIESASKAASQAGKDAAEAAQERARAEEDWRRAARAWGATDPEATGAEPPLVWSDTPDPDLAAAATAQARRWSDSLSEQERRLQEDEQRLREAREVARRQQAALEQVDGELKRLDAELRQAQVALGAAEGDLSGARAALESATLTLTESAPAGFVWQDDPTAALRSGGEQVAKWTAEDRRLRDLRQRLERLRPALATHAEAARSTQEQLTEAEASIRQLRLTLGEQEARRGALLGGQPVSQRRAALEAAVAESEQVAVKASGAREAASSRLAAAQAALASTQDERERLGVQHGQAREALELALAGHGLDTTTLRARLSRDPAALETEAQALAEIDRAVDTAATLLAERERRLEGLQATRPAADAPTAADRAAQVTASLEQARARHADHRARQLGDDARRQQVAELAAQIRRQVAASARWMKLNEVIGSADGARFQRFAQGITLDLLLAHANVQLAALTPRYELQRIPGEDLEVQVIDRDMADEIRPVISLSGGETFLASLALALGLASLSTSTPVRSLFIDEGFGTLDRETLEVALAALDALQHQGRQVGIISHVEGLAEHIGARVRVERVSAGTSRVVTG